MEDGKLFFCTNLSRNLNSLFNDKYITDKNQLNKKLTSILKRNKSLNHKYIKHFDYSKAYHKMKKNLQKFDQKQIKQKSIEKSITEDIKKFNLLYKKQNAIDSYESLSANKSSKKIIPKLFLKVYQNKLKNDQKISSDSFGLDPLLISNDEIKKNYLNKDFIEKNIDSLNYVNKLEVLLNENCSINSNFEKLMKIKLKSQNIDYNSNEEESENNFIYSPYIFNNTKNGNNKKYNYLSLSPDIKIFKQSLKRNSKHFLSKNEKIEKLKLKNSEIINPKEIKKSKKLRSSSTVVSLDNKVPEINENKVIKQKINVNQIGSLFSEYTNLRKKINEYRKGSEAKLKYIYSTLNYPSDNLRLAGIKNEKIMKIERDLLFAVNKFNN